MLGVLGSAPNHESLAIAAQNEDGQIVAIVPAVRVATLSGLASRLASRSIWYAEPICDPTAEGVEALRQLVAAHDARARGRCLFTEVRVLAAPEQERSALEACGYEWRDYLNYVVDTTPDADVLYRHISKTNRNKINRSVRRGVEIEIDCTRRGIERMYALVRESYQRSEVPLAGIELFHAARQQLGDEIVQVRIATHQGRDVAAGIGLVYAGRFFAWYGGTLRLPSIAPFDCLTWDEVRWSSENGLDCYDFGGAGWPDEEYGPREFKKKFGGELVRYGRYRRVYSPFKLRLAETAYGLIRGSLSRRRK